ncbi:MAG: YbjN domain-containing protein [Anaerolineae bacterium]
MSIEESDPRQEESGVDGPRDLDPEGTGEHVNAWRAFATLNEFLRDDGWHPQQLDDNTIVRVYFGGKHGDVRCYAQIRVDLEQFLFYVIAPVKAPEETRDAVARFLTRANFGLRIGNFEMDYNDGEVRYKSSIDFEGEILTPGLIRNAIYPAVHTMDVYLPGLLAVMYGNTSPDAAIEEIEG